MTTGARTLRLLSLLQTHRFWSGDELAQRLEVSLRTLRRDIDRVRELGYPVHASPGVAGGYQLIAGSALPPLILDDEEAVAIAVALQQAANGGVAGIAESSVRALAALAQVLPPRLRQQVDALRSATAVPSWPEPADAADPEVLLALAQACRGEERITFDYRTGPRHTEPVRLVPLSRRWYLVGYDLDRQDWRTFRVDRIHSPRPTGARFRPRELPGGDAVAFVRSGLDAVTSTVWVEVLLDLPVERVVAAVGRWATATAEPDGRTRMRMRTDNLGWAAMAIGTLDTTFQVVEPPELVTLLRTWAERFACS